MEDSPPPPKRLARRSDPLRLLDHVSTRLNSELSHDRILEVVLDSVQQLLDARYAAVFLHGDDRALRLSTANGQARGRVRERVRVGQGIVGAAAAKRAVVRVNLQRGRAGADVDDAIDGRMAIPMLARMSRPAAAPARDDVVGVVLIETLDRHVLSKEDERLAGIIANHAAVALQNARLYAGLQELNEQLEERVQARTAELATKHRQLQEAQAQLLQSGKLAALGELAAGLAHEMNTPLGAINASADVSGRVVATFRSLQAHTDPKLLRALQALEQATEASRKACDRVSSIVATLRNFAHLDRAALQPADLNASLDQALALLAHRTDGQIAVTRDYAQLPPVRCFVGDINQVLLGVLTNAIDAIDGHGTIRVESRVQGPEVAITIADSGVGIPADSVERVFDPGFTTKGVGIGTGLGLAIAYRIVERHAGRITVASAVGRGTEVLIRLPVAGSPS